ncbi:FtsX-like permease family protein [Paenibacillus rhizoplanae]
MICVALYTLGFTIADAILSNYRTIGIIKSVGLSSRKVIMAYVAQYTFLALVSVIPGMLVSNILSGTIVAGSMAYLNTGSSGMNDLLSVTGVGTSVAVVAVIFPLGSAVCE